MIKAIRIAVAVLAVFGLPVQSAVPTGPEVVVNVSMRESSLSRNTVKAIFFGNVTRWESGRPIVVYVLPPDHPTTKNFAWNILRVTPHAFEERISSMVATRDGNPPRVMDSETAMLQAVMKTPNSIGYLSSFVVINNANSNLRAIPIL